MKFINGVVVNKLTFSINLPNYDFYEYPSYVMMKKGGMFGQEIEYDLYRDKVIFPIEFGRNTHWKSLSGA